MLDLMKWDFIVVTSLKSECWTQSVPVLESIALICICIAKSDRVCVCVCAKNLRSSCMYTVGGNAQVFKVAGRSRFRDPMRWINFFNLPDPSGRTRPWGSLRLLTEMSTRSRKWGVECGRCVGLTILSPSVSRLCRQCGIVNISQSYGLHGLLRW
jgi:hypothetical protein